MGGMSGIFNAIRADILVEGPLHKQETSSIRMSAERLEELVTSTLTPMVDALTGADGMFNKLKGIKISPAELEQVSAIAGVMKDLGAAMGSLLSTGFGEGLSGAAEAKKAGLYNLSAFAGIAGAQLSAATTVFDTTGAMGLAEKLVAD